MVKRVIQVALSVALLAVGVSISGQSASADPAPAGEWCIEPYCGDVDNDSSPHAIRVANCWPNGATEREYGDELNCGNSSNKANVPSGGDGDDYFADVDAFRAYRGCVTTASWAPGSAWIFDRRGRDSMWVRVHNDENVRITGITCYN
jgi:hypothetical protein